jgi:hypothetical protein
VSEIVCACSVCRSVIQGDEIFGPGSFPACAGCYRLYGGRIEEIGALSDSIGLLKQGQKIRDLEAVVERAELPPWSLGAR